MPEVPALSGLVGQTAEVFRTGGALARTLPGYEPRASQVAMADRVASAIAEGGVLLAEAGTGTGKTLAYLVPAILSRQRVLISTGTKNLQEQIFFKDIPTLRGALDVPFTATCMKGRNNYLCLHRLDQLNDGNGLASHDVFLPIVRQWSAHTETGDRAELTDLPEDLAFWGEVSATADTCLGSQCPRYSDCFVTKMRQRAAEADVVIVNHHLLCADAAVRKDAFGEVIPACAHVVVDEAHQLEDIATQYFGFGVSNYRIDDYARDVERFSRSGAITSSHAVTDVEKAVAVVRDHARAFFSEIAFAHRTNERLRNEERVRATDATLAQTRTAAAYLAGALDGIEATLALLARPADDDTPPPGQDAPALARRAGEIRDELRALLRADDPAYVYFVEFRGKAIVLRAAPIDVSAIIRELLFDRTRTTVLTSATLTVDSTFDYIKRRLGIAACDELQLRSEFDYARQAILYLPKRMPDPRLPEFAAAAGREVIEILKRTRGRAFVLFTSYASLRAVQPMAEMALGYPILVQGTAPRSQLLAEFRATPHSVLLATSSFWQGVDVVGESLSCVIVDKLPFASPGDPVTAARIDTLKVQGEEPFETYQVPLAILTLQQGLGRLIRHRTDRGVLVVLDPRLRTKGYGRRFLASLPPAPVVHDLAAVEAFFSIV